MTPLELEQLLVDERWVRALARRVAGRAVDSEDLAQDAWLAWLRAPAKPRDLRPWLARVLRRSAANAVRATLRRQTREERVAQTAPTREERDAAELTAELELHARLNRALAELEEPQRNTLVRHFHHGKSLTQIARADGLALSTVQARVARGLERLRNRLDRDYGGRRAAWIGLASELELAPQGAATWGKLAMASASKMAAAAAVVLGVGGWWLWSSERAPDVRPHAAALPANAAEPALAAQEPAPHHAPAVEREATQTSPPAAAASAPLELASIRGRVIQTDGRALAGIAVRVEGALATSHSSSDGTFELACAQETAADARLECADELYTTVVPGTRSAPTLVVERRQRFDGRVLDPHSAPIAGAEVGVRVREALFRQLALVRPEWDGLEARWRTTSDSRGGFELTAPSGAGLFLHVDAPGFHARELELSEFVRGSRVVVLEPRSEERVLAGVVLSPLGEPVAGAEVSWGETIVASDAAGRFELPFVALENRPHPRVIALKAPFAAALADIGPPERDKELVLRLGAAPQRIRGHVRGPSGEALANVVVYLGDPTPLGGRGGELGDEGGMWKVVFVEEALGGARYAVSGANGAFELSGLFEREYELRAHQPATTRMGGPWTVRAGASEVELVLHAEAGERRVAGRVVRPNGEPLAGVDVRSRRPASRTRPPHVPHLPSHRSTDADGRFEFESLVAEGAQLELLHNAILLPPLALDGLELDDLRLEVALLCDVNVDLRSCALKPTHAKFLDRRGATLQMVRPSGPYAQLVERVRLEDAGSGLLRVPETARTLVLLDAERELARIEFTPDVAKLSVVSG
jgi:RNA polymerase sigma-70 factor (ECF subfamily)